MSDNIINKPWGKEQVLYEDEGCKVKRLTVNSGCRLSYQYHYKRQEHWTVISGVGRLIINGEQMDVGPQTPIQIGYHVNHSVANIGELDLVIIEVQTGEYFGDDDIVRIYDDYNRGAGTEVDPSQRGVVMEDGNATPAAPAAPADTPEPAPSPRQRRTRPNLPSNFDGTPVDGDPPKPTNSQGRELRSW